ncbi:MAG: hypothetical protein ACJ71X_00895, partial [Nitrososphaeraceae archaeon]
CNIGENGKESALVLFDFGESSRNTAGRLDLSSSVELVLLAFFANAEPTKPPLTTISDEAMAMVNRAAIVLFVNILPSMITLYSLRNMIVNRIRSTLNIVIKYASIKK